MGRSRGVLARGMAWRQKERATKLAQLPGGAPPRQVNLQMQSVLGHRQMGGRWLRSDRATAFASAQRLTRTPCARPLWRVRHVSCEMGQRSSSGQRARWQRDLSGATVFRPSRPDSYEPVRPARFCVSRIYLAKGSIATPERRRFVERICALYHEARVEDCPNTPHNRIELGDALGLHQAGKQTLVFGELNAAVRFSQERGNACPNY